MITTLHIKNIGIIDDLNLELNNGFNVLTGETGAGKTLIIESLGIIAGGRFSKEMIRKGETHSFIEVCLYLPENEKAIDGNIIISREIYSNGRNMCKINGRMVTVAELKEFMEEIIDIHGQNDNQLLLKKEMHIGYLDDFANKDMSKLKKEYSELYVRYNEIKLELKKNYGDDKEKERKLDLLKYQLNEIEESKLKRNEEEELEEQRRIMQNSEKIAENLNEADNQIGEVVLDSINAAIRNLEKIEIYNEEYGKKLNSLKSIYYDLQEISRDINNERNNIYFDQKQREEIENRLDLIYSLKRKYGNTIEEILKYKNRVKEEIQTIENLEEYTNKLKIEKDQLEEKMEKISIKLNEIRNKYGKELSEKINKELYELEMKNAKFETSIKLIENKEFNKNGLNEVEFMITTNIGEDAKPLAKIASGGEMSRIMLAIKTVLADIDKVPILIFDEIDTGISGIAANVVGEKLQKISRNHQVIIITHLASIAAKGKYNYYIHKEVAEGKTRTQIDLLNEENVIKEIARIASGSISEIALKHAFELRNA